MKIGLIDNDLAKRDNHNFPNLAIMKLSSYHKNKGDIVELIGFDEINPLSLFSNDFDLVYVSKAFTDTETPEYIFKMNNVKIGGTGFYFDKAEPLPYEIEHSKPDYDIYQKAYSFIKNKTFFEEYSIGYTTRGCFRHCEFCVNKNLNKVELHSQIDEFYDPSKKKLAMLDDNVLGLPNKELYKIFDRLEEINKPFQYRQGMDIRLLTEERIDRLLKLKYDDIYYFAFDKMTEIEKIKPKIELWSEKIQLIKPNRKWIRTKFYTFCAFDYEGKYDLNFWLTDIENLFKRIQIMFDNKAIPFVMRFKEGEKSPFRHVYINIGQWANSPSGSITIKSFNEWIDTGSIVYKETIQFRDKYPQFRRLFDAKLL
jgi:hypothetical protein